MCSRSLKRIDLNSTSDEAHDENAVARTRWYSVPTFVYSVLLLCYPIAMFAVGYLDKPPTWINEGFLEYVALSTLAYPLFLLTGAGLGYFLLRRNAKPVFIAMASNIPILSGLPWILLFIGMVFLRGT